MIVCPQCHHHNLDTSKFCSRCGTPIQHLAPSPTPQPALSDLAASNAQAELDEASSWSSGSLKPIQATVPPGVLDFELPSPPLPSPLEPPPPLDLSFLTPERTNGNDEVTLIPDPQLTSRLLPTYAESAETSVWQVILYPCDPGSSWLSCDQGLSLQKALEQDTEKKSAIAYLDVHKRYRCLTDFVAGHTTGQVVDEHPEKPTLISQLNQALIAEPELIDLQNVPDVLRKLQAQPTQPSPVMISYLALRLACSDLVPAIHDAWVGYVNGQLGAQPQQIILVENRSQLPSLWQAWQDENLEQVQLLAWMEEMTELWSSLEAWGCVASLLDEDNLCVTPDGVLAVRRLDFTPINEPGAKLLGKFWQGLFVQTSQTRQAAFSPLWIALQAQSIQTMPALQELLQQLWETLQSDLLALDEPEGDYADLVGASGTDWQATLGNLEALSITEDAPTAVLPKQLVHLEAFGLTDTGRQRHHNEDFYLIQQHFNYAGTSIGQHLQARGVYVLCDGMGGHAQGEVASSLAAKTLYEFFQTQWPEGEPLPEKEVIRQGIFAANQAIYDANEQQRSTGSGRMGTTLIVSLVENQQVCIAHVGDSRVYRYTRRHGLEQLTVDHEVGQRDIKRGVEPEIAYARPDAYQLTQALGPRGNEYISPEILTLEVHDDTLFLLCSDGLTDNRCLESHVETHIAPLLGFDLSLAKGVRSLIAMGNEHNGHDNLTVIAMRMKLRSELDSIF